MQGIGPPSPYTEWSDTQQYGWHMLPQPALPHLLIPELTRMLGALKADGYTNLEPTDFEYYQFRVSFKSCSSSYQIAEANDHLVKPILGSRPRHALACGWL